MEAAVDRLEVKVIQAQGLRGVESGTPSAYAEVREMHRRIDEMCLRCVVWKYDRRTNICPKSDIRAANACWP